MSEPRRYFPDWTRCLFPSGRELEADHNSYLAGGYAEEFGYTATEEWSRGVPVPDGPPDRYRMKRGQAQLTHPGYPLRPHPFTGGMRRRAASSGSQREDFPHPEAHGGYFAVHVRAMEGRQGSAEQVAKRTAVRVASSLVSLRWSLRRGLMFQERRR